MTDSSSPNTKHNKKRKSSSRPTASALNPTLTNVSPEFLEKLKNSPRWQDIVDLICKELNLPDINTRSGLKKIHRDFDTIHRTLHTLYAVTYSDKVAGAVVGIFGKLAEDGILLRRIIKETGFLDMAVTMLDDWDTTERTCVVIVIQSLCRAISKCDVDLCPQVVKEAAPMLMRVLEERPFPDNDAQESALEALVVIALSHCVRPVCLVQEGQKPSAVLKKLDTKRLTRLMVSLARRPIYFDHVFKHFVSSTYACSSAYWATPRAIDFLVACTRSVQLEIRNSAIISLLLLHAPIEEEEDTSIQNPETFMDDIQQKLSAAPERILVKICERGPERSEMVLMIQTIVQFRDSMVALLDSPSTDWIALGHKLVELILQSEYLPNGTWTSEGLRGRRNWPCASFFDTLPHCAKAIRAQAKSPEDHDKADILDIKYRIATQQKDSARRIARNSIKRSPEVAFFYYAASIDAEPYEGLHYSKKGLKCSELTDYVRFNLLYRASSHALELAQMKLMERNVGEGYAFAMSALEDSRTYLRECPPDSRRLRSNVYVYALSLMLVKGPELTVNSPELKEAQEKLDWVDEYAKFEERPILRTRERLTTITLLRRLEHAWEDWSAVLLQVDAHNNSHCVHPQNTEEYLATLLSRSNFEQCDIKSGHEAERKGYGVDLPTPKGDSPSDLYRCSWCRTPSAVLKRCKACEKARYCDEACQSRHWNEHKKDCGGRSSKT